MPRKLLSRLFQYRFKGEGDLGGHSFGNLFLAALAGITGDFSEAVRLSSEILASKGHIYPASVSDVRLCARLTDGAEVAGETSVTKVGPKIEKLFLDPLDPLPHPEALKAIGEADLITLGPGSLFTSLIPPLLVPELLEAVSSSDAAKVFICNLMTQPGETDHLTAKAHLDVLSGYFPNLRFGAIVVNNAPISAQQAEKYRREGAEQIGIHGSIQEAKVGDTELFLADLLAEGDLVRHDPLRLAEAVLALGERYRSPNTEMTSPKAY
ncbi:uridine diphosphate-N-acetylglucosamine-binding protein YvcK [Leptolyngbya sp. 7M]|uniref:gluconeogenesis factor YvcK family protein n=1 Tax=Leptolyngbya sp. 7M TaxID=2812896 RepID=UPI001CED9420|nr:uridine diphosphate-N-acetylglucosamine-binding protein YvcK [Leptolyngbya sp. 7M]